MWYLVYLKKMKEKEFPLYGRSDMEKSVSQGYAGHYF